MTPRTWQVLVAIVASLVPLGCTPSASVSPAPSSVSSASPPSASASPNRSPSQLAAEDTTVKAYTTLWKFLAVQTQTRDIEAEFSPFMRNVRNNGTEGFLAQSEKYVNGIVNGGVVASGVPKFTMQTSRDATPIEGRPTVYVRACADLSTVVLKNYESGASLAPLDPSKDPRVFTVEPFADGWRVVESEPTQDTSPC